mgnify:FL=1
MAYHDKILFVGIQQYGPLSLKQGRSIRRRKKKEKIRTREKNRIRRREKRRRRRREKRSRRERERSWSRLCGKIFSWSRQIR